MIGQLIPTQSHYTQMRLPSREQIGPDTPLRLSVAAALAFPDGSMTASGLRRRVIPWSTHYRAYRRQRLYYAGQR